jgi:hypothetical protein
MDVRRRRLTVRATTDLIKVVGEALKTNLTMLGPLILPYSEQVKFLLNWFQARPRPPTRQRRSLHVIERDLRPPMRPRDPRPPMRAHDHKHLLSFLGLGHIVPSCDCVCLCK